MVIEILGGYSDGYIANLNNYYLYQDPDSGQYLYIAADLDLCLGATVKNITDLWTGNYNTFPGWGERPLADQMMRVPEFNQKFKQLLQELNTKLFNPDVMNPRINDLADMIREDVVWDQALNEPILRSLFDSMGASDGPDGLKVPGFTVALSIDPTVADLIRRLFHGVSFDIALNGPTGYISLTGLKEWFSVIHQNTANFFSQQ